MSCQKRGPVTGLAVNQLVQFKLTQRHVSWNIGLTVVTSGASKRNRLQNRSQFFLLFSRHHCEADLERETRAMHGKQVLQAIKEIKISNKASLFLILFRWVYFLSKANVKNRTKIRDSMLTWLKRVTAFRSHAKGHAILCDVYYLLTNGWSDERFSKSKSLVCGEFSFLFVSRMK